jgi:hypothetical protein
MIVVETNSCPSGQKSMPILVDSEEQGGYRVVIENSFANLLEDADQKLGGLAVIYDKNPMEATGYAAVMADVMKEDVWVAEFYDKDPDPPVKWVDKVLFVRDASRGTDTAAHTTSSSKQYYRVAFHPSLFPIRDAKTLESFSHQLENISPQ